MANVLKRLFGGVDDAHAELVRIREQVERTKGDIAAEEVRPVPLAEIESRLNATIAGLRAQAERRVQAGELARPTADRWSACSPTSSCRPSSSPPSWHPAR
jgi:hypothetical protein